MKCKELPTRYVSIHVTLLDSQNTLAKQSIFSEPTEV